MSKCSICGANGGEICCGPPTCVYGGTGTIYPGTAAARESARVSVEHARSKPPKQIGMTALKRLQPASTVEDRKTFAGAFNLALDVIGVDPGDEFLIAHPDVVDKRVPKAGTCSFCGKDVNPNRDYRRVTGWEKRRAEGGTNALRLREPHEDEWACVSCVDREARGVGAGQAAML